MIFPMINLDSICRPRQWKTISANQLTNSGYIVYGANGKIGFYSAYTHEYPTVMITCRGATCGNVHISEPKSYINGNAMALDSINPEVVSIKYLKYCLINRGFQDVISGSAQPQITGQGLSKVQIPLPPLATQKQIAAVLEKADQLRKDCQQMEQELNSLAQSVFIDMFGDPVTNPKGWKVRPLESLIVKGDRINYGVVQPGLFETVDTGVPLIRISDFSKGKISLDKIKFIGTHVDAKYKRSKIIGDEILIACVGATIGKTAIVTEKHKGYNIARAVTRVRVDGTINRYFLQKYLESDFVQSFFIQETRSVGQPTLNTSLIAKTPILIPDENTQNLFLKFSEQNDEQIINAINLAEKYELQFNALMQQAFKGKLNLTDAPH